VVVDPEVLCVVDWGVTFGLLGEEVVESFPDGGSGSLEGVGGGGGGDFGGFVPGVREVGGIGVDGEIVALGDVFAVVFEMVRFAVFLL